MLTTSSFTRVTRIALAGGVVLAVFASPLAANATGSQTATISGTAFRDFNSDGAMSVGNDALGIATDFGLDGVTVNGYDADDDLVGTAVTVADGTYTLTVTGSRTTDVRVEFVFSPGQIAAGYESSYHGPDSGTSVQFVSGDTVDVDFAANIPQDYSQNAPGVAVSRQIMGDPFQQTTGAEYPALSRIPWRSAVTPPAVNATINVVNGTNVPTGSIYGLAYQRSSDRILSSAVVRRFTGFGPGGIGGIYQTDAADTTSIFVDLENIGIDLGGTAFSTAVGDVTGTPQGQNIARGLTGNIADAIRDAAVYPLVGKTGIGSITMNSTDDALLVMNLYDGELYRVALPADGSAPTAADVTAGGLALTLGSDDRPWAVKVWHGRIYVGVVSEVSGPTRGDLTAQVWSIAESGLGGAWTQELEFDLDFTRGSSVPFFPKALGSNRYFWNPWLDTFDTAKIYASGGFIDGAAISYPQPILTGLSFDARGNLSMGFADRFGMQNGNEAYRPDNADTNTYRAYAAGDLLVASPVAGVLTLEANGSTAAGVVGAWSDGSNGVANTDGPGNGEFYQDYALGSGPNPPRAQTEIFTGGLAVMAGVSQAISTVVDTPISSTNLQLQDNTGGLTWSSTASGALEHTLVVQSGGFAKANGLGALELLADAQPVEIGNRTWYDADQDGIQDADEPALPGVTVTLEYAGGGSVLDADGNPVAPVVTDGDGNYFFSNLVTYLDYVVHFDYSTVTPADLSASGLTTRFGIASYQQLSFTKQVADAETRDSNADPVTGDAPVSLGGPGQNDHTIDAGFIANGVAAVVKEVEGDAPFGVQFEVTLECVDFRGDALQPEDTFVLMVPGGSSVTQAMPAGSVCDVLETEDHGATKVEYAGGDPLDGGGVQITVIGTIEAPTGVVITNIYPPVPPTPHTPEILGLTGLATIPTLLTAGSVLLAGGAGAVLFTVIRRRRTAA